MWLLRKSPRRDEIAGVTKVTSIRDGILPEESKAGAYRAVGLLYLSGCLYASTVTTVSGSAYLFTYFHLAFFVAVICIAASRGFLSGLWRPAVENWAATFLLLFLLYWLVMGLTHSNVEVGMGYAKNVFNRALPGFLLGYITFATYGCAKTTTTMRGDVRWNPSVIRRLADALALAVYAATLYYSFSILIPKLDPNLFLIVKDFEGDTIYQIFGNYIILSLVCAVYIVDPYFRWRYPQSLIAAGLWASGLSVACWTSFLLAQMVGSNAGAVLSVLVGCYGLVVVVSEFHGHRRMRSLLLLLIFSLAIIWVQRALSDMPPMRIFDFS